MRIIRLDGGARSTNYAKFTAGSPVNQRLEHALDVRNIPLHPIDSFVDRRRLEPGDDFDFHRCAVAAGGGFDVGMQTARDADCRLNVVG